MRRHMPICGRKITGAAEIGAKLQIVVFVQGREFFHAQLVIETVGGKRLAHAAQAHTTVDTVTRRGIVYIAVSNRADAA